MLRHVKTCFMFEIKRTVVTYSSTKSAHACRSSIDFRIRFFFNFNRSSPEVIQPLKFFTSRFRQLKMVLQKSFIGKRKELVVCKADFHVF